MNDTKQYYIKILLTCNNNAPAYQRIIRTFAGNEEQAEANIDEVVEGWKDIEFYWIRKITTNEIDLYPYLIEVLLVHPRKTKTIKMKMHMEAPSEASELFATLSEDWNYLRDFQILKVTSIK